jgi:hypothetical protein
MYLTQMVNTRKGGGIALPTNHHSKRIVRQPQLEMNPPNPPLTGTDLVVAAQMQMLHRWCDTPGVSFVLRRENYPNLECSVKISISRSRMSLISQTIRTHITEFGVIQSHKRPNLEPVKTFISRNECELDNHSRIINLI